MIPTRCTIIREDKTATAANFTDKYCAIQSRMCTKNTKVVRKYSQLIMFEHNQLYSCCVKKDFREKKVGSEIIRWWICLVWESM